jgi:hypothetical protein
LIRPAECSFGGCVIWQGHGSAKVQLICHGVKELVKRILERKNRPDLGLKKLSPDYPGDSLGTLLKPVNYKLTN